MATLEVGKPFLGERRRLQAGVQLSLSGSSPELHLIFDGITTPELNAIKAGKAEFGVYEENGVLFFLYQFGGGVLPWSDTPYHVALEQQYRDVNLQLLTEESRGVLLVILVDASNAIVRALRVVSLPPEVTRALWQAVLLQNDFPSDYDAQLEQIYTRVSSKQMVAGGVVGVGGS